MISLNKDIAYYISQTGATVSVHDYNLLSSSQQEQCKEVLVSEVKGNFGAHYEHYFKKFSLLESTESVTSDHTIIQKTFEDEIISMANFIVAQHERIIKTYSNDVATNLSRYSALVTCNIILNIPEHRVIDNSAPTFQNHHRYIQTISNEEREFWQAIKKEIENQLNVYK